MNKRLLKYLIPAAVFIITVVGIFIFLSEEAKSDYRLEKFDLSQIPGINAAEWDRRFNAHQVPHLILRNIKTDTKKYVFSTADCGIIKHGYKNRVELFVVFNSQGKIENVILGKNIETPKLIKRMHRNGFFQQWNGRNKLQKVQYVTGATYSSKAVSGGISELLDLLKRENFFR